MPLKSVGQAMSEFKKDSLHSGRGGPLVKTREQAIAIGLSAERKAGRKVKRKRTPSARAQAEALK